MNVLPRKWPFLLTDMKFSHRIKSLLGVGDFTWHQKTLFTWALNGNLSKMSSSLRMWTAPTASQMVLVMKNLPVNAGDKRDTGWIPGSGRSPGGGNGNLLQYSCLENPMDRGA